MNNYIQKKGKFPDDVNTYRIFYFKVNFSKTDNPNVFEKQLDKVILRIRNKYNLKHNKYSFTNGFVYDDFAKNKFTLKITFLI